MHRHFDINLIKYLNNLNKVFKKYLMLAMCDIKTLIASIYNNNNNFISVDM